MILETGVTSIREPGREAFSYKGYIVRVIDDTCLEVVIFYGGGNRSSKKTPSAFGKTDKRSLISICQNDVLTNAYFRLYHHGPELLS